MKKQFAVPLVFADNLVFVSFNAVHSLCGVANISVQSEDVLFLKGEMDKRVRAVIFL